MGIKYKDGYAYVDGYKFRRDTKTGYYLSTKKIGSSRKRLHVYVWEKYNGQIPEGYEIHHKDENKDNNDIANLACMTRKQHLEWHAENMPDDLRRKFKLHLDQVRPKATEWHRSEEGREWHREHARKTIAVNKPFEKTCINCKKKYKAKKNHSKFCSPNCQTAYRKKSGVDNETRECVICSSKYEVNKYSKSRTCSRQCRGKLNHINRESS